ncbi:MAG: TolC family protein, partial [Bacteroidia bacterium]|nr:TolC family protein [Bacteroidia bacterium]
SYYETSALPNAQQIIQAANLQLSKGEISFIEFSLLMNQAIETQSKYSDILNEYNQTIIQLNYLTQTN